MMEALTKNLKELLLLWHRLVGLELAPMDSLFKVRNFALPSCNKGSCVYAAFAVMPRKEELKEVASREQKTMNECVVDDRRSLTPKLTAKE